MTQITAQEAAKISKLSEHHSTPQKPSDKLIEEINKRIASACAYGKFYTMLNSMDSKGIRVRGIGVYLSNDEIESIENYYKGFGFKIGKIFNDRIPLQLKQVWIEWREYEQQMDEMIKEQK